MSLFGYQIGETYALNHSDVFLEIVSTTPAIERGIVSENPIFRFLFSDSLMEDTVDKEHFILRKGVMRIPTAVSYDSSKNLVIMAPKGNLVPGEYQLVIDGEVQSKQKIRLQNTYKKRIKVETVQQTLCKTE
jgi:hypothetical protein